MQRFHVFVHGSFTKPCVRSVDKSRELVCTPVFLAVPGSTSGVFGSLETCSARVYRSSGKFSEAIFAHLSRLARGRFTGDGGRLGGVFQQKFKLDYGNTQ